MTRFKSVHRWMEDIFRPYIATLLGTMRWRVALALSLMLLVSATQGARLLLVVPLMQQFGLSAERGSVSQVAQFVAKMFGHVGLPVTLATVLGALVLFTTFLALLARWQNNFNFALNQDFVVVLRRRFYRAIAHTDWLTFSKHRSSDFVHALTTELTRVGMATVFILQLGTNAILLSVYMLFALWLSVGMTGVVLGAGLILLLLLRKKNQRALLTGEEVSLATNGMYSAAIEHLSGMKTAKSYGVEDRDVDIFSRLSGKVAQMCIDVNRNQAETAFWFNVGSVVVLSIILYLSYEVLRMPAAGLLLMLLLFNRMIPLFGNIQKSYQQYLSELPAFARIAEMQAGCEAATERKVRSSDAMALREEVRFEKVSFSYNGSDATPLAIRDLTLTISAGQTTAIVGPSGAGKSTIADLVMGLIVPNKGRVVVDGKPLSPERIKSWRDNIGYVTQETFLFNDTVQANLLWARPDATEAELVHALRLSAAEFVFELPEGVHTALGDRGVRLSGGERQRLALARALLRKPSILILDEATSALDSENERRIQDAIEKLHGHMTILVITHRLSTIRGADVIHVLERGRLEESGDWDALLGRRDSRFGALCRAQGIGEKSRRSDTETPIPGDSRLVEDNLLTEERYPRSGFSRAGGRWRR